MGAQILLAGDFAGAHGDKPITPTSGRLLAQLVVERKVSCVIDLMTSSS